MPLSCHCDFYEGDVDAKWYCWSPSDYTEYTRKRGKRCCSENCDHIVRYGDTCARIRRTRPGTEWEELHGLHDCDDPEAVEIAPDYLCERCADLLFSFEDLGFMCVSPYEDLIKLAKEYHEEFYGRKD